MQYFQTTIARSYGLNSILGPIRDVLYDKRISEYKHDMPDDFVIAAEKTCVLKDFVRLFFEKLRMNWEDHVQCRPEPNGHHDQPGKSGQGDMEILGWRTTHSI